METPLGTRVSYLRIAGLLAGTATVIALLGCGAGSPGYGSASQGLAGDLAPGYDTSLGGRYGSGRRDVAGGMRGYWPVAEASFKLATGSASPFDNVAVRVAATVQKPDGATITVPAFYDGDGTWRIRFAPAAPGQYTIAAVKVNGQPAHESGLTPKQIDVAGEPDPGFVHVDPRNHAAFAFDNGTRYFPLGQNVAWKSKGGQDYDAVFAAMHAAGENWARVWMSAWDGKALMWSQSGAKGEIDLASARQWDQIVQAATKQDIYLQVVVLYHGQYSTTTDSNWSQNPWNSANGGFLHSPSDFFTSPQARALTRRLLAYLLARWGAYTHLFSIELFNEVQFTDAVQNGHVQDVTIWHREMSDFVRLNDPYHHLVTTSSPAEDARFSELWQTVDFVQAHVYTSDPAASIFALGAPTPPRTKPFFVGEFGTSNDADGAEQVVHDGLWASVTSGAAGAAAYWNWDRIAAKAEYPVFTPVARFLAASGLPSQGRLTDVAAPVDTTARGTLVLTCGGGWSSARKSLYEVSPTSASTALASFPSFIQGRFHRSMTPDPLQIAVDCPQPSTVRIVVANVARSGAHAVLRTASSTAEANYPAAAADHAPPGAQSTLEARLPAGKSVIRIENTGADWFQLANIQLVDYSSAIGSYAVAGGRFAAGWMVKRSGSASADGTLHLPELPRGSYTLTWWDTQTGAASGTVPVSVNGGTQGPTVHTPQIAGDVAWYAVPEAATGRVAPARVRASRAAVAPGTAQPGSPGI